MLSQFNADQTNRTIAALKLLGVAYDAPVPQPKELSKDAPTFLTVMVHEVYRNMPKAEHYEVLQNKTLKATHGNVTIIASLIGDNNPTIGGNAFVRLIAPIQTKLADGTVVFTDELYPVKAMVRVTTSPTGDKDNKGRACLFLGKGELLRVGTKKDGTATLLTHAVENPVEGGRKRVGVEIGGKGRNVWHMEVAEV